MTNQVIQAEAVEAAARKLCALAGYDWDNMDAPEDVVADFRAQLTAQATAILEAAAPYMARHFSESLDALDMGPRSVWHDAVSEAYVEGALSAEQANVMWAKNPYRSPDAV